MYVKRSQRILSKAAGMQTHSKPHFFQLKRKIIQVYHFYNNNVDLTNYVEKYVLLL